MTVLEKFKKAVPAVAESIRIWVGLNPYATVVASLVSETVPVNCCATYNLMCM